MAHFAPAAPLLLARPGLRGGSGGLNDRPLGDRRPSLPAPRDGPPRWRRRCGSHQPAPKSLAVAGQCIAEGAGGLAASEPVAQVAQYPLLRVGAELVQVADSGAMKFDPPDWRGHQRFTVFVTCRSRLSSATRGPPRARRRRAT